MQSKRVSHVEFDGLVLGLAADARVLVLVADGLILGLVESQSHPLLQTHCQTELTET